MNPDPFAFDTDPKLAERHLAAMNKTALYNTDLPLWEEAARCYRARPDGGPTLRALEGNVWGIPKLGWLRGSRPRTRPSGCCWLPGSSSSLRKRGSGRKAWPRGHASPSPVALVSA